MLVCFSEHSPEEIMHEPEPDAAPWSFLNIDSIFSNNYYGDSTQHEVKICHEQYIRDSQYVSTENDEIVARSLLQEELSQLSIEEPPELSHSREEYLQDSTVGSDWHNSSSNYYAGISYFFLFIFIFTRTYCIKFPDNLQKVQAEKVMHMRVMMVGVHARALEIDHLKEMIILILWT